MAKKTLLSEGQVRHFMKLASIAPLAETFLSEMEGLTEEEVVEEDKAQMQRDVDIDRLGQRTLKLARNLREEEDEAAAELDADEAALELGDEEAAAEGEEENDLQAQVRDSLAGLLELFTTAAAEGVDLDFNITEEADEAGTIYDPTDDVGDALAEEDKPDKVKDPSTARDAALDAIQGRGLMGVDLDLGPGPDVDAALQAMRESVEVIDDEKIVQEVAARVAKRLLKESRQDQLAESLAKRIAEKLR